MNDLDLALNTFKTKILGYIDAEVRRQITANLDTILPAPSPEAKKRGPKAGNKATAKPCPVTGIPNTHRRFSYLMPEARTPENLAKFKGGKK